MDIRAAKQPLLCVVHIPKTAGSAIRETLISSLGPEKVYWIGHKRPYEHWDNATGAEFDDYAVVGGHRCAEAFRKINRPKIFMAVVRDPIKRAISLFNYITRGRDLNHGMRAELQGLSLLEALDKSANFRREVTNRQCEFIGNSPDYFTALQNICENEWYIDRHENVENLFRQVCKRFGWPLSPLIEDNVGEKDYIKEFMSERVVDLLTKMNGEDLKLAEIFAKDVAPPRSPLSLDTKEVSGSECGGSGAGRLDHNLPVPVEEMISAAYRAVLNRPPDPFGLSDYKNAFVGTPPAKGIEHTVRSLLNSDEFRIKQVARARDPSKTPAPPKSAFFTPELLDGIVSFPPDADTDRIIVARFRAVSGSRPTIYVRDSSLTRSPRIKESINYIHQLITRYLHQAYCDTNDSIWEGAEEVSCVFQVGDRTVDTASTIGYVSAGEYVTLIPDLHFWMSEGYKHIRDAFRKNWLPWAERTPIAFWRGASTGAEKLTIDSINELPRYRLCALAAQHRALGGLVDARLTKIVQASSGDEAEQIRAFADRQGLLSAEVPQTEFLKYRFQIDIDGNSNSWGFLLKLLTGSCVIKVLSCWKQWYYHELQPWKHYVPVRHDLSDIEERVRWCLENDEAAREIGENAQKFAARLAFDTEMRRAAASVVKVARSKAEGTDC